MFFLLRKTSGKARSFVFLLGGACFFFSEKVDFFYWGGPVFFF